MRSRLLLLTAALAIVALLLYRLERDAPEDGGSAPARPPQIAAPSSPPDQSRDSAPPAVREPAKHAPSHAGEVPAPDPRLVPPAEAPDGTWLIGRVVGTDGRPLPGATVELLHRHAALLGVDTVLGRRSVTDADGGYAFEDPPGDTDLVVEAHASGYAARAAGPLRATPQRTIRVPDLALPAGVALTVLVRGDGEAPLPGAKIELSPAPQGTAAPRRLGAAPHTGETNAGGRARFDDLDADAYVFRVSAPGHADLETTRSLLAGRLRSDLALTFDLEPARGRIDGTVVDGQGRPLPGVTVRASTERPGAAPHLAVAESGPDGRFVLEGLLQRPYRLGATARDHAPPPQAAPLEALPGGTVEIRMLARGGVRGRVERPGGGAPAAFTVELLRETPAGAALVRRAAPGGAEPGAFAFDGVEPGRYLVRAIASDAAPGESPVFEVPAGGLAAGVVVRLARGATITGRALDEAGRPLEGVDVALCPPGYVEGGPTATFLALQPVGGQRAASDEAGAFRIDAVAAGSYTLRLARSGHVPEVVRDVVVTDGGTFDVGVRTLPRGGVIAGEVRDAAGAPAAYAVVTAARIPPSPGEAGAADAAGALRRSVPADALGGFRFEGLAAGRWRVTARAPADFPPARGVAGEAEAEVVPGGAAPVVVTLAGDGP